MTSYNFNSNVSMNNNKNNWSTSSSSKANKFMLPNNVRKMLNMNSLRYLNSGKFGAVYNSEDGVIKVTSSKNIQDLALEYDISILAGEHKIGPKVFKTKSGIVEHNGMFYLKLHMEKMNTTLQNYKKQNNVDGPSVYREISQKVNILHSLGFCHNDIHVKNVMYKSGEWYLIDFGKAARKQNGCSKDVNKLGSLEYELSKLVKERNRPRFGGMGRKLF